jgi:hypothetical protein
MYNPKNVFGMKEVSVAKTKGSPVPVVVSGAPKTNMVGVKTSGIKARGTGAATKGTTARGPMA